MSLRSRFLEPDFVRRLGRVELIARELVEGLRAGRHSSPYRGDSVEFAEHRSYAAGDDPRRIDWKVYARRERYYVRQYHEESNLVATVLLDASASMTFGSRCSGRPPWRPSKRRVAPTGTVPITGLQPPPEFVDGDCASPVREVPVPSCPAASKLEYACILAAGLVYVATRQHDTAAMGIFDTELTAYLPPTQSTGFLQRISDVLEAVTPTEGTNIGASLAQLSRRIDRRGWLAVISDFLGEPGAILEGLQNLRARGHDIIALQVLDPAELSFDWRGPVRFEGLESSYRVMLNPERVRDSYLRALHNHLAVLRQGCSRAGIDYHLASTSQPPGELLLACLAHRGKGWRGAT